MRCPATRGATVATPCSLRGHLDADPRAPAPSHVSRVPWAGTCPLQPRVHTGHVCCSHVTTGRVTALLRPALSWGPRWLAGPGGLVPVPNMVQRLHCYYGTVPNMVQWLHYYYRTQHGTVSMETLIYLTWSVQLAFYVVTTACWPNHHNSMYHISLLTIFHQVLGITLQKLVQDHEHDTVRTGKHSNRHGKILILT